jgi:hypothetical protein
VGQDATWYRGAVCGGTASGGVRAGSYLSALGSQQHTQMSVQETRIQGVRKDIRSREQPKAEARTRFVDGIMNQNSPTQARMQAPTHRAAQAARPPALQEPGPPVTPAQHTSQHSHGRALGGCTGGQSSHSTCTHILTAPVQQCVPRLGALRRSRQQRSVRRAGCTRPPQWRVVAWHPATLGPWGVSQSRPLPPETEVQVLADLFGDVGVAHTARSTSKPQTSKGFTTTETLSLQAAGMGGGAEKLHDAKRASRTEQPSHRCTDSEPIGGSSASLSLSLKKPALLSLPPMETEDAVRCGGSGGSPHLGPSLDGDSRPQPPRLEPGATGATRLPLLPERPKK